MKLRFKTLEEIPEKFRDKAVKEGEEFVVDVEGLLTKNSELLEENKKHKKIADSIKGMDVEKAKQALAEMQTLEDQKAALEARVQAALAEQATKHESALSKVKGDMTSLSAEYEGLLVRSTFFPVLNKEKGIEPLLMPALTSRVKVVTENGKRVVKVMDDKGNPKLDDKGVPYTPEALIADFKKDPIYSRAFEAPAAGGSGAAPGGAGGGGGQGAQGTFQLTETQARDRGQYTRLSAEAAKAGQTVSIIPG